MREDIEYERPPDEDEWDEERPRMTRRERRRASRTRPYMMTRDPYSLAPIRVYDDEDPDEAIEKFIAEGHSWWLEKHDPEKAREIRSAYYEKIRIREGR